MDFSDIPPIQTPPAPPQWWEQRVFFLVLGVILVALLGGLGYLAYVNNNPDQLTPTAFYHSNTANIQFRIPSGWSEQSESMLILPLGFTEPTVILQKLGSACTIAQAKWGTPEMPLKQVSFSERVFSTYSQFDGNWVVASTSQTSALRFSDHSRQRVPGEVRIVSGLRQDAFLLFMTDGTAVPDACNEDLNSLLRTIEPYYETTKLTSSSTGIIEVEKVWDDVTYGEAGPNKSYEHLVFTPEGSQEKFELMKLPSETWSSNAFSVVDNKIYVPVHTYHLYPEREKNSVDGAIVAIDPFAHTLEQIPGSSQAGAYIRSVYIRDKTLYYLKGNSETEACLSGYEPCPTELYSIPLTGGVPVFVAKSSLGGNILGYLENEKALYIRQTWGDAGCMTVLISKIVAATEQSVGKFSGCSHGSQAEMFEFSAFMEQANRITTMVQQGRVAGNALRVSNGTLAPLDTGTDRPVFFSD